MENATEEIDGIAILVTLFQVNVIFKSFLLFFI